MTRLTPEGKALRTRGLQAGRQAVDSIGESRRSAPRLGIRLAWPLPSSNSVGVFRLAGPFGRRKGIVASPWLFRTKERMLL